MNYRIIISVTIVTVAFLSCKTIQLDSRWIDRKISFEGKAAEWNDIIQYPQDAKFGIGVMNDDKYLYLCMTSWDQTVTSKIMHMGFTAWFETKSGKGKPMGIHYPIGMAKSGFRRGLDQDTEVMKAKILEALEHIEILGPGKDDTCPTRTIICESMGIITRIVSSEGNCVYEIKVPLNIDSTNKFAIGVGKDDIVQVKLETSTLDAERMKNVAGESAGQNSSGGMGGGGGGGMGGGMHGGGGGHGGGMHGGGGHGGGGGAGMSEPFKISFDVKLSNKPAVQK